MLRYQKGGSLIHRTDPRIKVLWLIGLSSTLLIDKSLALPGLALVLIGYLAARISVIRGLSEVKLLLPFILFPLVLHGLADPGEPVVSIGLADITREGIFKGVENSTALFALTLSMLLFIYTTEAKKIEQALYWFKVPAKMVFMLTITLRFLPLMKEELTRIRIAQAARGHKAKGSVMPLIIPLLHKSLTRAWKLAVALETRGFDPEKIIVDIRLKMNIRDYALFALFLVFAGCLVYFK